MTWKHTYHQIKTDIWRRADHEGRPRGRLRTAVAVASSSAGLATIVWRIRSYIHHKGLRFMAKLLGIVNMVLFTTEIEADATIGEGFLMLNPNGVMIHGHTRIGKNCTVAHQATMTIGPRPGLDPVNDYITIGDDVTVSAGVRIIGNLAIGENVFLGPNTVVAVSVPADHILAGRRLQPLPKRSSA